jgi:isopenicillin N synthase-like dioxygenase
METSFERLHDTAIKLLEAIALGLGLSQRYFEPFHTDRAHEFRLLHYPEIKVEELSGDTKTRTGEHTDFGTITLLFQDGIGGLEAEDQLNHDSFRPICAEWPIMIVNIGDSMQRWTNARLKSAQHRVTVPPSLKDKDGVVPERYSVAFFGKPNRDVSLLPFPELLKDAPSKYGDMTAGEYNRIRHLKVY